ncbi:MAG TPA: xanthine phosphoribosyltransferase [Clostridiaceae bacterium]|jgi:xanthine phosphoribosyltransferase|nr:xanthine phosphoribosyltransferase [Clostridiaceae bacterium]
MDALKARIRAEGKVLPGNILLVDQFLNQQVDPVLIHDMAEHWYAQFADKNITKILTIEASGIAIAVFVAARFGVPLLFAKKYSSTNVTRESHEVSIYSYTKQETYRVAVSKRLLTEDDNVLIIDDFLANGQALKGLLDLCRQAGATVAGVGIAIEKIFQNGRDAVKSYGVEISSLARIESLDTEMGSMTFAED